jgi:two-component system, OmpR family, response regulator MprA
MLVQHDGVVPYRVLIADDDRAIRESLARALELEGFEVEVVNSASVAQHA